MDKFSTLLEAKPKIVKSKSFYSAKKFEILYTLTDGKKFILNNDKSVWWADKTSDVEMDETIDTPRCKSPEYDVMEYNKKLGVYNTNMKLMKSWKNMKELVNEIDDFLIEKGIDLIEWS